MGYGKKMHDFFSKKTPYAPPTQLKGRWHCQTLHSPDFLIFQEGRHPPLSTWCASASTKDSEMLETDFLTLRALLFYPQNSQASTQLGGDKKHALTKTMACFQSPCNQYSQKSSNKNMGRHKAFHSTLLISSSHWRQWSTHLNCHTWLVRFVGTATAPA